MSTLPMDAPQVPVRERQGPYQTISGLMTPDVSRYVVDDLVSHLRCGRTSTILLFESPHTSEVIQGYPLAGEAGARVAKAFLGTDERSIGEILNSWQDLPSGSIIRHIGIMNVCRLPMQRDPYRWSLRQHEVLHHLSIIRENPGARHRTQKDTKHIEKEIEQDLCRRIMRVRECVSGAKFVLCGRVAREFARKIGLCNPNILDCVPHPTSRGRLWPERRSVQNMVDACRLTHANQISVGRIEPSFF